VQNGNGSISRINLWSCGGIATNRQRRVTRANEGVITIDILPMLYHKRNLRNVHHGVDSVPVDVLSSTYLQMRQLIKARSENFKYVR
jgi:hypothetical protein